MKRHNKEIIGSFTVINPDQEYRNILISQDNLPYYSGDVTHTKALSFETIDGPAVESTDDPNIFLLPDGTRLKKKLKH